MDISLFKSLIRRYSVLLSARLGRTLTALLELGFGGKVTSSLGFLMTVLSGILIATPYATGKKPFGLEEEEKNSYMAFFDLELG